MLLPPKSSSFVDDQVSTRPSGRLAAPVAICGHSITSPQRPRLMFSAASCAAANSGGATKAGKSCASSAQYSSPNLSSSGTSSLLVTNPELLSGISGPVSSTPRSTPSQAIKVKQASNSVTALVALDISMLFLNSPQLLAKNTPLPALADEGHNRINL